MGVLVEQLAPQYGCEIAGIVTEETGVTGIAPAPESTDVAIDFTTADAVAANMEALARRRINVVIGTTGWQAHERAVRAAPGRHVRLQLQHACHQAVGTAYDGAQLPFA